MTERRWKVLRHLIQHKEWDFFMVVEIGVDRIQHGFWKYFDEGHRKFEPYNRYQNAILDYYRYLDGEIGALLKCVGDDTVVIVVSDHGAKKMEGCININDWMIQEGYLKIAGKPDKTVRLQNAGVDWTRTRAWGLGGYYGRVFLNVKGREPQGIVDPADYEQLRNEISEKLIALKDDRGHYMDTRVLKPQEVFNGPYVNEAPDLFVYFGDLYWRSTEDIGHEGIYSFDTEVGPDDAVHDEYGIFILYDPSRKGGKRLSRMNLMDGAPTILDLMGIPIPGDMEGKVIRP
jgi:predicted AlkP superfamily phosphohydrolase/phosphomutase